MLDGKRKRNPQLALRPLAPERGSTGSTLARVWWETVGRCSDEAVVVALVAIGVTRHLESVRADRHREHVRGELEPVFARFLETEDSDRLAEELRPAFLRMDAAHRPVAAVLVADMMQTASYSQQEKLGATFEEAEIVERASGAPTRRSSLPSRQGAHR